MSAMGTFLDDFEKGVEEKRYIPFEFPNRTPFGENSFDIGLSSHSLLTYTQLGYGLHVAASAGMLRVCREVRIFPLVDLNSEHSDMIDDVIGHYSGLYEVSIERTDYRFQRGGDRVLMIRRSSLP